LDVRGDGGFVVAPPSVHASGQRYAFDCEGLAGALAPVPGWIHQVNERGEQAGKRPPARAQSGEPNEQINAGTRNRALFGRAIELRFKGADEEEIARELLDLNRRRCVPPLDTAEVLQVATSAARYPSLLEELTAVEAAAARRRELWKGSGGANDLAVLRAHLAVAERCRRMPYHADVRTLGDEAGLSRSTASRANGRLVRSGWLVPHAERSTATTAKKWHIQVPPELRTHTVRDIQDIEGSNVPEKTQSQGQGPIDRQARGQRPHPEHDVWRWGGGLGKSCERVYEALLESPSWEERSLANHLGLKTRTGLRRHLNRLRAVGLAMRVSEGRWAVGRSTLTDAARLLRVDGHADQQRERYAQERLDYREQLGLLNATDDGVLFDPETGEVLGRSPERNVGDPVEYAVRRSKEGASLRGIARELAARSKRPDWLVGP
jgi:hypothetical protein